MKQVQHLKVNAVAAALLLFFSAGVAFATEQPPLGAFAKAGFVSIKSSALSLLPGTQSGASGASLTGKSMGSLNTIGFSQGEDFIQTVSRRQNKIHSFSNGLGTSPVFFGESDTRNDANENSIMNYILKQMNVTEREAASMPQLWTSPIKRKGKVEVKGGFDTYEYQTGGFSGGIDIKANRELSLGMAVGYSRSSSTFEALGQTNTAVDGYHAAFYTTYEREKASIDNSFSFTYFQNKSERSILGEVGVSEAEAKASGYQFAWMLSAMGRTQNNGFVLTPLAGFTFATLHNGGMQEEGAGAFNLSTEPTDSTSFKPMLGFDVARHYDMGSGIALIPEIYTIYRYEMLGTEEDVKARLSQFDEVYFNNSSTHFSRHSVQLGTSLGFKIGKNFSSKLQLDSDLKPSSQDYKANFTLSYVW